MIHPYQLTELNIFDPFMPINPAPYLWSIPTKLHSSDPSISTNRNNFHHHHKTQTSRSHLFLHSQRRLNALSSGVSSHSFGVTTLRTLVSLHSHRSKDIFRWRNLLIRSSALIRITRSKQAKFKDKTGDCLVIISFKSEFATHRKINISLGQYLSHRSYGSMMTIYLYYVWRLTFFYLWWSYIRVMYDGYYSVLRMITICLYYVRWLSIHILYTSYLFVLCMMAIVYLYCV